MRVLIRCAAANNGYGVREFRYVISFTMQGSKISQSWQQSESGADLKMIYNHVHCLYMRDNTINWLYIRPEQRVCFERARISLSNFVTVADFWTVQHMGQIHNQWTVPTILTSSQQSTIPLQYVRFHPDHFFWPPFPKQVRFQHGYRITNFWKIGWKSGPY